MSKSLVFIRFPDTNELFLCTKSISYDDLVITIENSPYNYLSVYRIYEPRGIGSIDFWFEDNLNIGTTFSLERCLNSHQSVLNENCW